MFTFTDKENQPYQLLRLDPQQIIYFKQMLQLFAEVFETPNFKMPSDRYLEKILNNSEFYALVVLKGKKVAGGITAHTLHSYYSESSEIYIYDLAVQPDFQRKGLGRELINAVKQLCSANVSSLFVQADLEDKHALDFYRSSGGIAQKVVHFNFLSTPQK